MAKQRRHMSSKPRRRPVQAPKPRRSLKPVANAKLESELYRQVAPGMTTHNRKFLEQRMDILAQYKPPAGRTAKVTFNQDTGAAEKTFYNEEGKEYDSVKITPQGKISMGAIEWNVAEQGAAGLVNICGTMNVPFAVLASECVPEDHPLAACVDESVKGALCCLENVPITLLGDCCSCEDVCEKNITGSPVVGEPGIITAAWPFAYPEDAVTLRIDCSGSATVLDSSGVAVSPSPIESVTWDSAAISATVEVTNSACCPEHYSDTLLLTSDQVSTELEWNGSNWESPELIWSTGEHYTLRVVCDGDGFWNLNVDVEGQGTGTNALGEMCDAISISGISVAVTGFGPGQFMSNVAISEKP